MNKSDDVRNGGPKDGPSEMGRAMRIDSDQDLQLLAFRYISNELTTAERLVFEDRLSQDLGACEAVAAVVEMSQAVALALHLESGLTSVAAETVTAECDAAESGAAYSLPLAAVSSVAVATSSVATSFVERKTIDWLRPLAWMSSGAAACLVAMMIFQASVGPRSQWELTKRDGQKPQKTNSSAEKLAILWSQLRSSGTDDAAMEEVGHDDSSSSEDVATDLFPSNAEVANSVQTVVADSFVSTNMRTPSWITAGVSGLSRSNAAKQTSGAGSDFNGDDDSEDL